MTTRIFLWTAIAILVPGAVDAQPSSDLIVRVYPVQDLIVQVPDYVYEGSGLSQEGPRVPTSASATGGYMSTSSGMGGMSGGMMGGSQGMPQPETPASPIASLVETIRDSVQPESWDVVGGPGAINSYESNLVVYQTTAVHEKIAELLTMLRESGAAAQTVRIEARWLLLDSAQLDGLQSGTDGGAETPRVDPAVLEELTRSATSYRGQITCFSGQRIFLAAGEQRNIVISVIPVVGAESVGYQPITVAPNLGVLLEGSATLIPGTSDALLDVTSTVTESRSTDGATWTADDATTTLSGIDRYALSTQKLSATLRVPLGTYVLVGGMTRSPNQPPTGSLDREQLYLIIRVTEVK